MLYNYGDIHNSSYEDENSFILRFRYNEFHNTWISFTIDATDIAFVENIAKGRIVKAVTEGFTKSTRATGRVVVTVMSEGELSAYFIISLRECFGRKNLPSKKIHLRPGKSQTVSFPLLSTNKGKIDAVCNG